MSFPRAKLHRFNDVQSDVPSPTRYDPKMDKSKGVLISKTEQRERTTSCSDTMSTGGTPFRTPFSVVKKHSCVTSTAEKSQAARCMNFGDLGVVPTIQAADCDEGELNFLREDCANKTETIVDLEKIVENLTAQVTNVEREKVELEKKVTELEAAKSALEATAVNNENYERQLQEFSLRIECLGGQIRSLEKEKEELLVKKRDAEAKIIKMEEENLEFERRIVSLEGTLEQVQLECKEKEKTNHNLQDAGDKLKITIECLEGKISMLEAAKSNDEQTIFGLETEVSSMRNALETADSGRLNLEELMRDLQKELDDKKSACKVHEDTMLGLEKQLGDKVKEIERLMEESAQRMAELLQEKENLEKTHEQLNDEKKVLQEDLERKNSDWRLCMDRVSTLMQQHKEEIFRLQDEWEKKYLTLMQEKEECSLEKDAIMKLSDLKYAKILRDTQLEWEHKISEAEKEGNRRQSELLEANEQLRQQYEKQIESLEANLSDRSKENEVQNERYNEVVGELNALVEAVRTKDADISELSAKNEKLLTRVSNMLGEIKLLNGAIDEKTVKLSEMTMKFEVEWKKNEKLSEQLGELDSKVVEIENELKTKALKNSHMSDELKKVRGENNDLKVKNLDLRLLSETQKENISSLKIEVETGRANFNAQLLELTEELAEVKRQCRKFEIAMSDTRKSLEALGKRLMESENDVERLTVENDDLREKLSAFEADKKEIECNYREVMDCKIDLEQRLAAAERAEDNLRRQVKEMELKNCELELKRNEVDIQMEKLDEDKKACEESIKNLSDLVNEQNIKMVQMERMTLEQIEVVSEELTSKLAQFEQVSKERILKLNEDLNCLKAEKIELEQAYEVKCEEYDNLFTDHDILKTTFEIARKESDSLKKHYEEQRIELDTSILKMNNLRAEKEALAGKIAEVTTAYEEQTAKVALLVEVEKCLKEETLQLKEAIQRLETEVQSKQSALENADSDMVNVKSTFEQKLNTLRQEREKEVAKAELMKDEYKSKLKRVTEEMSLLLTELENERRSVEALEEVNKTNFANLQELTESKVAIETKLAQVLVHNKELQDRVDEISNEAEIEKKRIEEAIKALECEKAQLTADAAACKQWQVKWEKIMKEKEELNKELAAVVERKDYYKEHCHLLEKRVACVTADEESAVKDFYKINDILKEREEEIERLKKVNSDLESLIEPYREQLEQFQMERNLIENDRDQLRRQHLEQAAKLGHQNNKQKIQHVVKLKRDLLELKKDNERLQVELKTRNKTIEKLREQLGEHPKRLFIGGKRPSSTPFKGKENDSPVGIKHEPMSPSSPLRNRNQ